jgi:predicted nucleotidyltransferase
MVDRVKHFLADFVQWASTQNDIQGVALVGSYARNTATADSDVDLVILTKEPNQYLRNKDWTRLFGKVERDQLED